MNREEISSSQQSDNTSSTNTIETSEINGVPRRPRPRKRRKSLTPQFKLFLAFITTITPIVVAWLGYQASLPKPTPVPIPSLTLLSSPTLLSTDVPPTFTEIPSATFTFFPSSTNTNTATAVPSETMTLLPQPKLIVLLQANKTSGKAPLTVKLDARDSYLTDYSGQRFVCKYGPCHYSWKVYINGQQIGKAVTGSGGTFDYKFGKKGIYTVTVWVCRGQDERDCGGSGTQIVVT